MATGNYWYRITFDNGTVKQRNHVSKKIAMAAATFCEYEMLLLEIHAIEWGVMK